MIISDSTYVQIGSYGYKLMTKKVTFYNAQQSCKKWDSTSHLASIHSKAEHNALIKLLYQSNEGSAWLGGSDKDKEKQWCWDDGSKFSYAKWAPGEPNNHGGNQNCLQLVSDGWKKWGSSLRDIWDDAVCSDKRAFICKRKI